MCVQSLANAEQELYLVRPQAGPAFEDGSIALDCFGERGSRRLWKEPAVDLSFTGMNKVSAGHGEG